MKKTFSLIQFFVFVNFAFSSALSSSQLDSLSSRSNSEKANYMITRYVIGSGGVMGAVGTDHIHFATAAETFVGGSQNANMVLLSGFWHQQGKEGREQEFIYNFSQTGWYLVSLPVTPQDNSLSTLFPNALAAFEWNVQASGYNPANRLETKKGYWVAIPSPTTVTVMGLPSNEYSEHLTVGWHLMGTLSKPVDFSNPVVNPAGSIIACYGYEPLQKQYYSVYPSPPGTGILEPQQGFWLAVSQECDLTIGGTRHAKMVAITNKAQDLGFSKQFGPEPPAPPDALIFHQDICLTPPETFKLLSSFPNPFNPQTTIMYDLPSECLVTAEIFNIMGQRIRLLISGIQGPGHIQQIWNGRDEQGKIMDSGIYLYRIIALETNNGKNVLFKQTKKMLLVK